MAVGKAITDAVGHAARPILMALIAGFLLMVGAGFVTVAAWIGLADVYGPAIAALVLGCVYGGLGLLVLAFRKPPPPPPEPAPKVADRMADAFLQGISAGAATKRRLS